MSTTAHNDIWNEPVPRPGPGIAWLAVFAISLAVFAVLTQQLLANGYFSAGATRILNQLFSPAGEAGSLGQLYPVMPYLLSRGIAQIPFLAGGAPYYADCLAASVLLGLGFARMRMAGIGFWLSVAMIVAIAANPIFLFVATSGSGLALALLFAYVLAQGVIALASERYLSGGLLVGFASAGLVLSSPLGFYLLLVAAPFLVIASRQQLMAVMPSQVYVGLAVLPLAVLAILIGVNFGFTGDFSSFLQGLAGTPVFLREGATLEPWPYIMGGSPFAVTVVMLAGLLLAFPALMFTLSGVLAGTNMLRATLMIAVVVMVTGVVTTYLGVLSHPALLWAFAVPPTLVALGELRHGMGGRIFAAFALVAGIAGGWWLMGLHPNLNLTVWRTEMGATFAQAAQGFPQPAEAAPSER
jgi:hypothetical protein